MEITLTTTIDIPDSVLEDVLTTAVEGGINYWCHVRAAYRREDLTVYLADIHDPDENLEFSLTAAHMAVGVEQLQKAIADGRVSPRSEIGAQFLHHLYVTDQVDDGLGYTDAAVADAIVQMACFGEIVYG